MGRLSIAGRLKRAKSLDTRREIAMEWLGNWIDDHTATIHILEKALQHGKISEAGRALGQLKELSGKRFDAMPNIIEKLTDDDI